MTDRTKVRIALTCASRPDCAAPDLPTHRGVQIAFDDLAERGDLPVELTFETLDDGGDDRRAAELAEQVAADESFVAAVGPMGSNEAFANAPVFSRAGMLQVSPCASHPDLCRRGFETFYRLVPNEEIQGSELARMALRFLGASRAAVVADSDAFGTTVLENFRRGYEQRGGEVVAVSRITRGSDDLGDLVERVTGADPDLVFFAVHAHEGKQASTQLRDAGLRVPFLGTDGLKTSFFLGGGDERGEAYHTHSGADFRRLPSAAEFRRKYAARFPEDSTYSPEAYDAVMLVAEAVRRAGSGDRQAVLAAFRELGAHDGVSGRIRFDGTGERRDALVSFYQVRLAGGERDMHYLGTTLELCPDDAPVETAS